MSPLEVQSIVLDVLREVQETSGRSWNALDPLSKPIGSLDGFDSLSAVEATVMIEQKLGCKLGVDSVFVSEDGKRVLNLKQISERIAKLLGSGREMR